MWMYNYTPDPDELMHYGIKGMKWKKRKAIRNVFIDNPAATATRTVGTAVSGVVGSPKRKKSLKSLPGDMKRVFRNSYRQSRAQGRMAMTRAKRDFETSKQRAYNDVVLKRAAKKYAKQKAASAASKPKTMTKSKKANVTNAFNFTTTAVGGSVKGRVGAPRKRKKK